MDGKKQQPSDAVGSREKHDVNNGACAQASDGAGESSSSAASDLQRTKTELNKSSTAEDDVCKKSEDDFKPVPKSDSAASATNGVKFHCELGLNGELKSGQVGPVDVSPSDTIDTKNIEQGRSTGAGDIVMTEEVGAATVPKETAEKKEILPVMSNGHHDVAEKSDVKSEIIQSEIVICADKSKSEEKSSPMIPQGDKLKQVEEAELSSREHLPQQKSPEAAKDQEPPIPLKGLPEDSVPSLLGKTKESTCQPETTQRVSGGPPCPSEQKSVESKVEFKADVVQIDRPMTSIIPEVEVTGSSDLMAQKTTVQSDTVDVLRHADEKSPLISPEPSLAGVGDEAEKKSTESRDQMIEEPKQLTDKKSPSKPPQSLVAKIKDEPEKTVEVFAQHLEAEHEEVTSLSDGVLLPIAEPETVTSVEVSEAKLEVGEKYERKKSVEIDISTTPESQSLETFASVESDRKKSLEIDGSDQLPTSASSVSPIDSSLQPEILDGQKIKVEKDSAVADETAKSSDQIPEPDSTHEITAVADSDVQPKLDYEIITVSAETTAKLDVDVEEVHPVSEIDQNKSARIENENETELYAKHKAESVKVEKVTEDVESKVITEVEPKKVAEVEPKKGTEVEPKKVTEVEPKVVPEVEHKVLREIESKEITEVEPKKIIEVDPKKTTEVEPEVLHEVKPVALHKVEPDVLHKVESDVLHEVEHKVPHEVEHKVPHIVEHKVPRIVEHKVPHEVEPEAPHKVEPEAPHEVEPKTPHKVVPEVQTKEPVEDTKEIEPEDKFSTFIPSDSIPEQKSIVSESKVESKEPPIETSVTVESTEDKSDVKRPPESAPEQPDKIKVEPKQSTEEPKEAAAKISETKDKLDARIASSDAASEQKWSISESEIGAEHVIKTSATAPPQLPTVTSDVVIDEAVEKPEEKAESETRSGEGEPSPSLSPAEQVAMATGDVSLTFDEEAAPVNGEATPHHEEMEEIKEEIQLKETEIKEVSPVERADERVVFTEGEFRKNLPITHEIEKAAEKSDRAAPRVVEAAVDGEAETKCSWDDIRMKDDEIEVVASVDVEEPASGGVGAVEVSELGPIEELPETSQVTNKDGDHDSGVDESTQGKDGVEESPSKKPPTTLSSTPSSAKGPPKTTSASKKSPSAVAASPAKVQKAPSSTSSQGSATQEKKVPMNKVVVGTSPSPNLKVVKSKIGSLENAHHKAGGGNVKVETKKVNIAGVKSKIGSTDNIQHKPTGGEKKIISHKLEWKGQSKVGSLDNKAHKPGGGDKKIETQKLGFKDTAKPKIGSRDNMQHKPGGGNLQIEEHKLSFKDKAKSKVGSMDNAAHKPGGGNVQIFDEKLYYAHHDERQSLEKKDSIPSSPSPKPSADNCLSEEAKSPNSTQVANI